MLVVVALGDGAAVPCTEPVDVEGRARRVAEAAEHLATLAGDHHLVVMYGFCGRTALRSLERALARRLPGDRLATVPTRVLVGAHDVVGRRSIVELSTLRILVDSGVTVLCPGDACIPVMRTSTGALRASGAVVDGDAVAARLAVELDADALLLLAGGEGGETPDTRSPAKTGLVRGFVAAGGWLGAVGRLPDAAAMLGSGPGVVAWDQEPAAMSGSVTA